jgi:hypothetical protein
MHIYLIADERCIYVLLDTLIYFYHILVILPVSGRINLNSPVLENSFKKHALGLVTVVAYDKVHEKKVLLIDSSTLIAKQSMLIVFVIRVI